MLFIESCTGRVNPRSRRLQVTAFGGRVREPAEMFQRNASGVVATVQD